MFELIDNFLTYKRCFYKNEHYSIRDNGAILRHPPANRNPRPLDNKWTFGTPNANGYLTIASEVVHRFVAFAFLGEPPTPQHIVDHIDTNRQNNRPENLRWLTKLENILNNPITVKRIIFRCGSIEAFLKDPSILNAHITEDPNFSWMRSVTSQEAETSWKRLQEWAKNTNTKKTSSGIKLGEWLYHDKQSIKSSTQISNYIESLSPNSIQINWNTPCEFPLCPEVIDNDPLEAYHLKIKHGDVFARNQYSNSLVIDFAINEDKSKLWVLTQNSKQGSLKPWAFAEIKFKDGIFVHESHGSFFNQVGAQKQFILAQGLEWTGGETFDDFC